MAGFIREENKQQTACKNTNDLIAKPNFPEAKALRPARMKQIAGQNFRKPGLDSTSIHRRRQLILYFEFQ